MVIEGSGRTLVSSPLTADEDPTSSVVEMAFTRFDSDTDPYAYSVVEPADVDWHPAAWAVGGPPYYAQILVGVGGGAITLAEGRWEVWVRVTDNPEHPVLRSGVLLVT